MKFKESIVTSFLIGICSVGLAQDKPNVLLILLDDLNDYPLGERFNNVAVPNLEKFASESVTFTQAYCSAPICNPSRTSFISGVAPYRSGIHGKAGKWDSSPLVSNSISMPEAFKTNGYRTMWSGKFYHGITTPDAEVLEQYWDEYIKHETFGPGPDIERSYKHTGKANFGSLDLPDDAWQDTQTADQTIERLNKDYDAPFFMVCGFVRPHNPWTAPERFFDMYDLDSLELPETPEDDWDDIPPYAERFLDNVMDFDAMVGQGLWKDHLRAYLACITFVDWNIGRVLDALDESNYAENTTVILYSDHGYHMGEKDRLGKSALWEQATRTWLGVKVPKSEHNGSVCDKAVSLIDIFPTMIEMFDLEGVPEGQLDGKSIAPLIQNPDQEWSKPVISTHGQDNFAIRDNRYRYIRYKDGGEELYDLESDPNEFRNLANDPEFESIKASLEKVIPDSLN